MIKQPKAPNQVFDKVDNATKTKSATTSTSTQDEGDTASTKKVLGAFAKAAQQNPNDTSSADVTMKALGILAGGGGVIMKLLQQLLQKKAHQKTLPKLI